MKIQQILCIRSGRNSLQSTEPSDSSVNTFIRLPQRNSYLGISLPFDYFCVILNNTIASLICKAQIWQNHIIVVCLPCSEELGLIMKYRHVGTYNIICPGQVVLEAGVTWTSECQQCIQGLWIWIFWVQIYPNYVHSYPEYLSDICLTFV